MTKQEKLQKALNEKQIGNLTKKKLERAKKYDINLGTEWGYTSARYLTKKKLERAKEYDIDLNTEWGFRSAYSLSEEELKEALSKHS